MIQFTPTSFEIWVTWQGYDTPPPCLHEKSLGVRVDDKRLLRQATVATSLPLIALLS
jgi:hypothetical protein